MTVDSDSCDEPIGTFDSIKLGEVADDNQHNDRLFNAIVPDNRTNIGLTGDCTQAVVNEYIVFDNSRFFIKFILVVKHLSK